LDLDGRAAVEAATDFSLSLIVHREVRLGKLISRAGMGAKYIRTRVLDIRSVCATPLFVGETRHFFSDARWRVIAPSIAKLIRRGPKGEPRRFLEAVVWILRSGAPWRDLAERFGRWESVYRRYRRWALAGHWEKLRQLLSVTDPPSLLIIDSTVVKAHPHAAGALRRSGGQSAHALGRSRGGFSTKVHVVVTEAGKLVRYCLTGGEAYDITQAPALVRAGDGTKVVGDRGYDSDGFIAHVTAQGMRAVIPSRRHRRAQRRLDRALYARRNVVERWFGRIKVFRRVATRYEKTTPSYLGFVAMAAMLIALTGWLR
jgi:transposase